MSTARLREWCGSGGREDVEWYAPAFLFDELDAHAKSYADKAEVDLDAWEARVDAFRDLVEAAPADQLVEAADHATVDRVEDVDPDDAVDLAAVVAVDADLLWTRDGALLEAFEGLAVRVVPEAQETE